MTVNPNWPRLRVQFAWCAAAADGTIVAGDPNDPDLTLIWTDATDQTAGTIQTGRGKQYELDQARSQEHTLRLRNTTGEFDPANTASRYAGRITTHRPMRVIASWPPAARNLLGHDLATGGDTITVATDVIRQTLGAVAEPPAWQGTNSLASLVLAPRTGTAWTVYPGQVTEGQAHIFSAWCASSAGLTVQFVATAHAVDGTVLGTVSGTAAALSPAPAWTRLAVSITPPAGTVVVAVDLVVTVGPAVTALLSVDGLQWEQAATASAWEEPGTDYPVITAYVDNWKQFWDTQTHLGWVDLSCTDALGVLSQLPMLGAYQSEVVQDDPVAYYELSEPDSSVAVAATIPVGRDDPGQGRFTTSNSLVSFGTNDTTIPHLGSALPALIGAGATIQPGGAISGQATGAQWPPFNDTVIPSRLAGPDLAPLARAAGDQVTWALEVWVQFDPTIPRPTDAPTSPIVALTTRTDDPPGPGFDFVQAGIFWVGDNLSSLRSFGVIRSGGTPALSYLSYSVPSTVDLYDGDPHHLVLTVAIPASGVGTSTLSYYVDTILQGTVSVAADDDFPIQAPDANGDATLYVGALPSLSATNQLVQDRFLTGAGWVPGTIAHVAAYDPGSIVLDAGRISQHHTAALQAFAGEDTAARFERLVRYSGWVGTARTPAIGYATVQALIDSGGQSALQALLGVTTDEQSNLFLGGDGEITLEHRHDRARKLTPDWILGEDEAAGETPYRPGVTVDLDDVQVFNRVTAARPGSITVSMSDMASVRTHFPRDYPGSPLSLRYDSDVQLVDAAQGILYRYREPQERISGVQLDPSANTVLWPTALGMQITDRVRLHRRPPGGAPAKTLELHAEQISHTVTWSDQSASWSTAVELSPAFWHAFAMTTAARSTLAIDAPAGSTVLTLTALPDAVTNSSQSNGWHTAAITQIQIWDGSTVAEEHAVTAMATTAPGYTTFTVTLATAILSAWPAGTVISETMDTTRGRYDTFDAAAQLDAGNLVGF